MGTGAHKMIPTMEITIANLKTLPRSQYKEIATTIAAMCNPGGVTRTELDSALKGFCEQYDETLKALAK